MVEKPAASNGEEATKERKGLWSPEEDERLYSRITRHGVSTWSSVAQLSGLRRSGKSCRLRWMNYLRPDLKKEPISRREEETIISLQKSLGNRWSVIAGKMPGRTDNEIKNYWNSRIRKRQQNSSAAVGCAQQGALPATADEPELAAPVRKTEPFSSAATTAEPSVPARFPLFACQLLGAGGGGGDAATACAGTATQSTTTHENNGAGSESEVSFGGAGEDAPEKHYYYSGSADMDMMNLLSFDDLLMDEWDQSHLYHANSGTFVD